MKFLRLTSKLHVDPKEVQVVRVNSGYDSVTVRMRDGEEHHIQRGHNESVWEMCNKLVKEIEDLTQ